MVIFRHSVYFAYSVVGPSKYRTVSSEVVVENEHIAGGYVSDI